MGWKPENRHLVLASLQLILAADVDVLQYALVLEHLEYAFYRDGIHLVKKDMLGGLSWRTHHFLSDPITICAIPSFNRDGPTFVDCGYTTLTADRKHWFGWT
jgi:hypothetical protein